MVDRRQFLKTGAAFALALPALPQLAGAKTAGRYDRGASDTEIRIGQTIPYSGPASVYGAYGHAQRAYFDDLNERGGINGRKVRFLSLDDGFSPPKTVEATRRLVEQDEVFAMFGSLGTATQVAVQKYLASKGVAQLLVNSGAPRWNDPKRHPTTTPILPLYSDEGRIIANYIARTRPGATVALLSQNDEAGRDFTGAFAARFEGHGKIVAQATYDFTDATVDSQMLTLARSGADVFFNCATSKYASQSIRKLHELSWKPLHILASTSTGAGILGAAGKEAATGIVAAHYTKQPGSPQWAKDPGVVAFESLRAKRMPNVTPDNTVAFIGYSVAGLIHQILERCGNDLTQANLLRNATSLAGMTGPALLPGVTYATTPEDFTPFNAMILGRYTGADWELDRTPVTPG